MKCWNPSWKWNFMANVLYILSLDKVDWDRSFTENKRLWVLRSVQEIARKMTRLNASSSESSWQMLCIPDIAPSIDIIYAYKDLNKSSFYVDDFSLHCAPENNQLSSSIIPLNSVDWTSLSIQPLIKAENSLGLVPRYRFPCIIPDMYFLAFCPTLRDGMKVIQELST